MARPRGSVGSDAGFRWALLPFLLLFTASAVIVGIRALERLGGRQASMFDIDLQPILGFPGRIIDLMQFVNSTVIVTLLILAVPPSGDA